MNDNFSQSNETAPMAGGTPYYSQWQRPRGNGPSRQPYQYPGSSSYESTESTTYGMNNPPPYQPTLPASSFGHTQQGNNQQPPKPPQARRTRKKRGCLIGCLGSLTLLLILLIALIITVPKVLAFGSAISTQSPLSSQTGYMSGNQRVNILILGYGGSGHDGAYLTDSMVIMSLIPSTHHTTLISVPRDLWVQNPANSGNYTKINAVYPTAAGDNNQDPVAGGNAAAQKVSLITGLQITYWMTINFAGFQDFIDAIGGIDVDVPDSFTANYPANDDPSINASWTTVTFKKGEQHMDGKTAIEYARARYVINNPSEDSDFARSQRQQLIMQAALVKMKQWQTWPHLFDAMNKLQNTLYSNLSLADLGAFALKMNLQNAHRVGISVSNVLVYATSSDGQSILLPANDDWSLIPAYIQKQLYQ